MPKRAARATPAHATGEPIIVWFRRDLRLHDNAALAAAVATGRPIVPVYVHDEKNEGDWPDGGAARWWLHHSLAALSKRLGERGLPLVLRMGGATEELDRVANAVGATAVYWNFRYEPAAVQQQRAVEAWAQASDRKSCSFTSGVLFDPETIRNRQGSPFKIFGAYWRHVSSLSIPAPIKLPAHRFVAPKESPESAALSDLTLLPKIGWAEGWEKIWKPGEVGAQQAWRQFARKISAYDEARDVPGKDGSSRLSAALHFGEIGPGKSFTPSASCPATAEFFPFIAARKNFSPKSAGASSRITFFTTIRRRRRNLFTPPLPDCGGRGIRRGSDCARGSAAKPATRSSTLECASYGPQAGCRIGRE